MNNLYELTERELHALHEENTGNSYKRQHVIAGRAMDAKFTAAEKSESICTFKNKHGWCKLHDGHAGSHTVVWLGEE